MFRAVVRYGRLRHLGEFSPAGELAPPRAGASCVVRTDRGTEIGRVLALANGPEPKKARGAFLREATADDLGRANAADALAERARDFAEERAQARKLALKVVATEQLLEGERLFLYYTAEDRLDLRELAREVQGETATLVELRQVGARERARACGGIGVCGRSLCCSTFLRELEPVTIRMAKVQGFSLAPESTQGACGRLKCCLRYEHPLYEESRAVLPRLGAHVEARRASGEVVALSVLARKITVKTPDGRLVDLFLAEIAQAKTTSQRLNVSAEGRKQASGASRGDHVGNETPPAEESPEKSSRWRGLTRRLFFGRSTPPPPSDNLDAEEEETE